MGESPRIVERGASDKIWLQDRTSGCAAASIGQKPCPRGDGAWRRTLLDCQL